jgi:hypothetical protein
VYSQVPGRGLGRREQCPVAYVDRPRSWSQRGGVLVLYPRWLRPATTASTEEVSVSVRSCAEVINKRKHPPFVSNLCDPRKPVREEPLYGK